jgi:hypothetical protein
MHQKKQLQHAVATSSSNSNHSGASSATPSVTIVSTGSENASASSDTSALELQQEMQYLIEAQQWGNQSQGGSPLSTSGDNINIPTLHCSCASSSVT